MTFPLHTLLVADEPVEPLLDALRRAGYDPRPDCLATPKAFGAALERQTWDVVILCHDVADLSVWEALSWLQRTSPSPPTLIIAGGLDEADVVTLIEEGVRDIIHPSHIDRLGIAVAKALRSQRERRPSLPEADTSADSAFRALAEHMPIGLYRTTEDGRILYANPALAQMLGRDSVEDLLGEEVFSSINYPREEFVRKLQEDGEVRDHEVRWEHPNGEIIFSRENTRAVRDSAGTLLYFEGTMEDVTEERRALHVEQHRARQLQAIVRFSAAVDAAQTSDDLDRAILCAVEEAMQADAAVFLRHSTDGFDVQTWSESIAEEVRVGREQEVWKAYPIRTKPLLVRDERTMESPSLVDPVRHLMRQAGLRSLGSFPLIHRGRPLGAIVAFFREPHTFTEGELRMIETLVWHVAGAVTRWQAERELRDSETSLRTITATTGHVLYRLRFGTDAYDHVSASIEKLTGYSARALSEIGGIDALIEAREVIEGQSLKEGRGGTEAEAHYLALYRVRTASGKQRWVEDGAYPWIDEAGEVAGLVGVLQDVTERREREEAAHEQSRRMLSQQRALNELSTLDAEAADVVRRATEVAAQTTGTGRVALWLFDDEGHEMRCHDLYVLENDRHRADVAFRAESVADAVAMLGRHRVRATTDILSKPPSERVGLDIYHARNGVHAVLTAAVRREGRVMGFVTFEHLGTPRTWTLDEQDFAGAVADLVALTLERGQRADAEAALRESELRYRVISELAADYAHGLTVEPDGIVRLAWATDAFERISGYTPDEVGDVNGLMRIVHEDDRPALEAEILRLKAGHTVEIEMRITTKSGEERWICHRSRPVRGEAGRIRHVYSTGQDITARKRFEAALVAAREEAEDMAQQKSDFLASMSHEIRTPLTGILGFAGVLVDEVQGEQREFARLIERSGRRLLATLNSVLDLAKLESNGLELTPEPLDIVDEARQVVFLLSPLADEKNIGLHLRTDAVEVIAPLDVVCLHRILNNLVGNAIKFTEKGHVTVEVAAEGDRVRLDVWDSGIGIDEAFLPHLFDEFKQETQGNNREGSGLGLAITKKLVEKMAGTLTVESEKGKGSRFTITFPLVIEPHQLQEAVGRAIARREDAQKRPVREPQKPEDGSFDLETLFFTNPFELDTEQDDRTEEPAPNAAPNAVPVKHREDPVAEFMLDDLVPNAVPESGGSDGDEAEGFLLSELSLRIVGEHGAKPDAQRGAPFRDSAPTMLPPSDNRPRVLVIGDDPETRRQIERLLGDSYTVGAATEARVALDRMAKGGYDALVFDVGLSGDQRGVNVLRVARTLPGCDRVVAVALTPDGVDGAPFIAAGFNCCISRPLTKAKLIAALRCTKACAPR